MKKQLLTIAAYVALQLFGLSGIDTAQAQYTYNMTNQTWTGFNFNQLPSGFTGTLTSISVNVTLNASVSYTYADDICVYVASSPLALGGLVQAGGYSNLQAVQRYSWPNGGSDAPGTPCAGTVTLTTPIVFTGAASDPVIWIGNGYGAAGTSGTWTGSATLNGISLGGPTCTAPTLSATTVAAICAGNANGSINLTTTGGSPTPLIYAWSNGGSTEDLIGLTAGTYTVTVTTQTGGCTATASYTVGAGASNVTYYADADGDTYGNAAVSQISCTGAPVGYVSNSTDCNDGNAAVNPAATEVCNGIDDDCDGSTDEGVQPSMPTLACYETANFNTGTCSWNVTGTQPSAPTGLACYETANFNTGSCAWDVTGTQPAMPTLACYETASFNSSTCVWDVTGTIPTTPTLACFETASFNTTSCAWDVTGSQPQQPTLACYESANFNTTTCVWDVTGTQPSAPTGLACYQTANFNTTTCNWDVTGSQPSQPSLACYQTASFNTTTCNWDVTGTQPSAPSGLACYETATFNSSTCVWDVTGSQPQQPTLACYESASFNTTTCVWDVAGTQPSAPSGLACYETATFNSSTCAWAVTGSPAAAIVTTTTDCQSYTWSANGTTYTQSGTYNYSANCQDYTLNLTITASTSTVYYADVDGDGYGNASSTTTSCNGAPTGYVSQAGDCNDNNANVNPAASEVCGNSIDDNCNGTTDEGTTVNANPISGNLQICNLYAGAKILTTTTVADASSYIWTVPSGMTIDSGQGTTSIVVSWGNIYLLQNGIVGNVTVTPVLSTTGCATVVPASIPVDLQYTAPVTPPSISGASAICPNESSVYSIALVKRASSYEWSVPTGASITSGNGSNIINVSYANGFTGGNITVGGRNVCGVSNPLRSRTVTLNILPAPTAITGPIDGVCNGSNANYSATAVVGATGYNWTVPATGSINGGSTNNNISVNYNSSFASGNITVAAVNNCGAGATRSVSLKAAPATPGTLSGPASACAGSTQSYAISTVQGASNYIWTVPGGAVINSGQGTKNLNVNHSTNASASGIITVKSSNTCGTSAARVLAVATTICPRLGEATTQLEVYPNPANSFINLSFNVEQSQQATIILRDAAGRIVYNKGIDAIAGFNNQQIEVSNLAKGVYFVQLQTGDSSENTRLIVE